MFFSLLVLVFFISGSFFFSGSETGFISWNSLKVAHLAGQGNVAARLALYMMSHRERFLTTILIGNNICSVGATISFVNFFVHLDRLVPLGLARIPSPESWFLTPVMVLFGEMLPKTLYRTYPFRLTIKSIPLLSLFYIVVLPFSALFSSLVGLVKKINLSGEGSYSFKVREEMVLIAGEGARRGTLIGSADALIKNILKLRELTVVDVAVGFQEWRKDKCCLEESQTVAEAISALGHDEEIVVFNNESGTPEGYTSLLEIATAHTDALVVSVTKKMPQCDASLTLLQFVNIIDQDFPRFSVCIGTDGQQKGIVDKMDIIKFVFGKIRP